MADDVQKPAAQWVEHPTGLALIPAAAPAEINETEPAPMAIRWEDWLDLWLAALERLAWCHADGLPNPYKVPAWFTRAARRRLIATIGLAHILPSDYADAAARQDYIARPVDLANTRLLPDTCPPAQARTGSKWAFLTEILSYTPTGTVYEARGIEPVPPSAAYLLRPHSRLEELQLGTAFEPPDVPWLTGSSADHLRPAYDDYELPNSVRPCADDLVRIVEPIETLNLNAVAMVPQFSAALIKTRREAIIEWTGYDRPPIKSGAEIYSALDSAATVTESEVDGSTITLDASVSGYVAYSPSVQPGGTGNTLGYSGFIEGVRLANLTALPDVEKLSKQTTVVGVELALAITYLEVYVQPARWRSGAPWQCSGLNSIEQIVQAAVGWLCPYLDPETLPVAYAAAGRSLGESDADFDAAESAQTASATCRFGPLNRLAVLARDAAIATVSTYSTGSELPYFSSLGAVLGNPDRQNADPDYSFEAQDFALTLRLKATPILTVQYKPIYPKIKRKK